MRIIEFLVTKWKHVLVLSLVFSITATGFFFVGKYSIDRVPIEAVGESLGIVTDITFSMGIETIETPNITRSGIELTYYSRIYVDNTTMYFVPVYLEAISIWLLIHGGPRDVVIEWDIGIMYLGLLHCISIDEMNIRFTGAAVMCGLVYQNNTLGDNNFITNDISYIYTNITVERAYFDW